MVVDEARDLHGTTHEIMARSLAMLGTHDGVTADDLDGGKDEHTFAGYHSQRSGHERVLAGFTSRKQKLDKQVDRVRGWIDEGVDPMVIGLRSAPTDRSKPPRRRWTRPG
ncbi:MAG: hypothetical protein WAX12_07740 [Candidatus Microthrix subdominans]|uniref:hypothetical protein n=1 Tax=Candidatus Neomicrothrix sp. TaxID=2719034 RepID=UPI001B68CC01|nr:hypothetical protein [Candidatus Microthrix sp.]MBK6501141.1 hypothetical protein [Candidatus Microthrix sp.]MBK7019753.1 hypothetical protein [Candidatus Microthrix sp.]MBK7323621.1 hypothetical protein [Candidatus Microthrix sp.]MBP6133993.1 hypothetical protein [Candidatus Microthrix sp.]MBP7988965.1 hypothetical protein [Candidatus Microthrix sp.]